MKIYLPTDKPVVSFDEVDFFGRRPAAEAIYTISTAAARPVVFLVDGEWGTGKTYFLRQLQKFLQGKAVSTVLIDAFALDYHQDAFLALSGELLQGLPQTEGAKGKSLRNATSSVARIVLKASLKGVVRAATFGVVGSAAVDEVKDAIVESLGDGAIDAVDRFVSKGKETRQEIENFKQLLSQSASATKAGFSMVLIDELDRCRPDFALDILERIKHFMNVDGLFFVLVANKAQFCEIIRKRYGPDFDAVRYLDKFFDFQIGLSSFGKGGQFDNACNYVKFIVPSDYIGPEYREVFVRYFCLLISRRNISLRDIERIFSSASLFHSVARMSDPYHACVLLGIAWLKHFWPNEYKKLMVGDPIDGIARSEINFSDLATNAYLDRVFQNMWRVISFGDANQLRNLSEVDFDAYQFLEGLFGSPVNHKVAELCTMYQVVRIT